MKRLETYIALFIILLLWIIWYKAMEKPVINDTTNQNIIQQKLEKKEISSNNDIISKEEYESLLKKKVLTKEEIKKMIAYKKANKLDIVKKEIPKVEIEQEKELTTEEAKQLWIIQ